MLNWVIKYGIVFYLFNTILLSIRGVYSVGDFIFFFIMSFYFLLFMLKPKSLRAVFSLDGFKFLLYLILINFLYFIIFDDISSVESIKYLFARTTQFLIIIFSLYYNINYFKNKFLTHVIYYIFFIVLLSLLFNPFIFSGRYSGITWNPNTLAPLTIIAFGILFLKEGKRTNFEVILLSLFLLVSLATGSRGVIIGIPFAFLLKYGFSARNISYGLFTVIFYLLISNLNLDTSMHRFSFSDMFSDRTFQIYYAYETFLEKPIFGWGLSKYAFLDQSLVPEHLSGYIIQAHNGYLAILVQYGLLFSVCIFYILFSKVFSVLSVFWNNVSSYNLSYLFIVCYTLIASLYESMLTGINEFNTILFWFSLAFLSYTAKDIR